MELKTSFSSHEIEISKVNNNNNLFGQHKHKIKCLNCNNK